MRQPLVSLLWRQAVMTQRLRRQVEALEREVDRTRGELAVQQTRVARWRRCALEMSRHMPEGAQCAVEFQALSDDFADLPEVEG